MDFAEYIDMEIKEAREEALEEARKEYGSLLEKAQNEAEAQKIRADKLEKELAFLREKI